MFINLNHSKQNELLINVKLLSESSIKVILMIFMGISFFISPISSNNFIVLWQRISFLNYIRAISFLIGCAFVPGGNIYNIFFSKINLHERFKVELFLIKITIYPLLSFAFIGVTVLILDQIGLVREYFVIVLFLLILGLFFADIIIQEIREEESSITLIDIKLSKNTIIILILSLGVLCIALGIYFGTHYLILGDSWFGAGLANFVGHEETSPIERMSKYTYYPIFWGYISFGLSVLSGLPYINTNALLAPFCYLFVLIIYLFMKAILYELKELYAVFSTIIMTIFSGFYIATLYFEISDVSVLIFTCVASFFYKTYSYYLFFVALAIYIITSKTSNINLKKNKDDFLLLIISAFFLIISFMVYMFPLLIGLVFIFLYTLCSDSKKQNLRLMSIYIFIITLLFIVFDLIMNFYLSELIYYSFVRKARMKILYQFGETIPLQLLIYPLLGILNLFNILIYKINSKFFEENDKKLIIFQINPKKVFKYFLSLFTILLIIEIAVIFTNAFFSQLKLLDRILFFYFLNKIFIGFGYIGILGIYLSYFCFRIDKKLFSILIMWLIFTIVIASFFLILILFQNFTFFVRDIDNVYFFKMNHWIGRIMIYCIIPLSILASIGFIEISKSVKNHHRFDIFFRNVSRENVLKFFSFSLLIYLSFSNTIIEGMKTGDRNENMHDDEIRIIGWMSENIPYETNILLYDHDYNLELGIKNSFTYGISYIDNIFKDDYNSTELIDEIDYLKENKIKYLLIHEDYFSESSDVVLFVKYYLIPNFYNESKYENDDMELYNAPYFE